MPDTTTHRLRHGLLVVAVVAAAGGAYAVTRHDTVAMVAPTIFKTATVEEGSLTTTESIDGSLLLSDTTTVLHRIEGQTATSSGNTSNAGGGATGAPVGAGLTAGGSTAGVEAVSAGRAATEVDACAPPNGSTTTTPDGLAFRRGSFCNSSAHLA